MTYPYIVDDSGPEQMPHSREAEEAVIGAIIIEPDLFYEMSEILTNGSKDFYIHRLGFIWDAFAALVRRNMPIDNLTVCEQLDSVGRLEEIGGPAYLTALLNQVPTILNAETYAQIVKNSAVRRGLLAAANEIARLAHDNERSLETLGSAALDAVTRATVNTTSTIRTARDVFSSLYDRVEVLSRQPAEILPGIQTGFTDFDRTYTAGGFKPGQLIYIGARPGEGKTAFSLSCIYNAAYVQRKHVALFSLEMDAEDNAERLIAMEQALNTQLISTGKLGDDNWPLFVQGIESGNYAPIYFDDSGYLTPQTLRAKCKLIKARYGLDLVVIDYAGLMKGDGRFPSRYEEMSSISRELKILARELKLPVLANLQLSRDVEKRGGDNEPQLSDLRDSGSFEQDGDLVMFLYKDKNPQYANVSHCKIAKQRKGPVGKFDLLFRREFTKFENLAYRNIGDAA